MHSQNKDYIEGQDQTTKTVKEKYYGFERQTLK